MPDVYKVEICNYLGQSVEKYQIYNSKMINVSDYEEGIYYIIVYNDITFEIFKLIIN